MVLGVFQLELGTRLRCPNAIRKKPFHVAFTRLRLAPTTAIVLLSVLAQNFNKKTPPPQPWNTGLCREVLGSETTLLFQRTQVW